MIAIEKLDAAVFEAWVFPTTSIARPGLPARTLGACHMSVTAGSSNLLTSVYRLSFSHAMIVEFELIKPVPIIFFPRPDAVRAGDEGSARHCSGRPSFSARCLPLSLSGPTHVGD